MKQLFASLLLGASLVGTLCAAPRTQQQAMAIAQQMAASKGHTLVAQSHNPMPGSQALQPYYVFDVQQGGFVIISGEDSMTALVGYSDRGSFDTEHMPDGLRYYLDQYAARVASVSGSTALSSIPTDIDYPTVEPLLGQTQWDQDEPYNLLCPVCTFLVKKEDGTTEEVDIQTITGCAATATSQIMYYHQYPANMIATEPYYTADSLFVDAFEYAGEPFLWSYMQPQYTGEESEVECYAVAALMSNVGHAMHMNYNIAQLGGSGAGTEQIFECLTNMGYDPSLLQIVNRVDFTQKHWYEVVNNELRHNRPIEYLGYAGTGGHAFVLDGSDGNGYYHINWGWGGANDGSFDLTVLDPHDTSGSGASQHEGGYHSGNVMIIGITPANTEGETMAVPDFDKKPDFSLIEVSTKLDDPDQNLYYCKTYSYYNPASITITNHSNREVNDVIVVAAYDTVRDDVACAFDIIGYDLKPGESYSANYVIAAPTDVTNQEVRYGNDPDETPTNPMEVNYVEIESPWIEFTLETNCSDDMIDEQFHIVSDSVVEIKLTANNVGGPYLGKDFAIGYFYEGMQLEYNEFPVGVSEWTYRMPIEEGEKGEFLVFTKNNNLPTSSEYMDLANYRRVSYYFIAMSDVTAIEQIGAAQRSATSVRRYNLQGQPVGADYRGLFIKR